MVDTPVYAGPALPAGTRIAGPAIIEHPGTTIVVLAGQDASIDEWRNTHITPAAAGRQAAHA
jgi:N-methylhydantoinase A